MEECIIHSNSQKKIDSLREIEAAIAAFKAEGDEERQWDKVVAVLEAIRIAITKGAGLYFPSKLRRMLCGRLS